MLGGIVSLAMCVLFIAIDWMYFVKCGLAGWKSLIPIYNGYSLAKATSNDESLPNKVLIVGAVMFGLSIISSMISGASMADAMNGGSAVASAPTPLTIILGIIDLAALVYALVIAYQMSRAQALAFGKGTGFAIGLFLLSTIFRAVIAFGDSEFLGPQD